MPDEVEIARDFLQRVPLPLENGLYGHLVLCNLLFCNLYGIGVTFAAYSVIKQREELHKSGNDLLTQGESVFMTPRARVGWRYDDTIVVSPLGSTFPVSPSRTAITD